MLIFDIQRNSFVDGPGIRTTVFLKGCNLGCQWCHNPESQSAGKELLFYRNKCIRCGKCNAICPRGAIRFGMADRSKCDFCGKCELYCQRAAIRVCGKEYSPDELMGILKKDRAFYENSGGGVTFSGGECMLLPEGFVDVLKRCRESGIRTAIDTAGNVPWDNFEKVLPYTDLFLYDIKAMDPEIHREYTGADNALILDNLKRLLERGAAVQIRVPVVPGVNDSAAEMEKIRRFLEPFPGQKPELLPYHRMGEGKYDALGRTGRCFSVPDNEKMETLRRVF